MNTDKQPQMTKTADEFLFEYGINIMDLNDDFNCQLLFAMQRYAEHYASYQRDIKIGDKVAFNYTDKQPQSCFIYCHGKDASCFLGTTIPSIPVKEIQNVYIFTPEELEALLQKERREAAEKAWVEAITFPPPYIGSTLHYDAPYEEYIRREQYLDQHYPLPQPPKK